MKKLLAFASVLCLAIACGKSETTPPAATPIPTAVAITPAPTSVCKQRNSLNLSVYYCLQGDGTSNVAAPCPADLSAVANCAVPVK